jgi:RNA polymerase sigma-70 factor (ECF subfamily)
MLIRVKKRTRFLHIDAEKPWESTGPVELPADDRDPEEDVIGNELSAVLNREIRRIPPLLRNALVLRDVQELSMPDVAAQLKITVPAAKSRLLRARSELRNRMTVFCGRNGSGTSNRQRLGVKLRQVAVVAR